MVYLIHQKNGGTIHWKSEWAFKNLKKEGTGQWKCNLFSKSLKSENIIQRKHERIFSKFETGRYDPMKMWMYRLIKFNWKEWCRWNFRLTSKCHSISLKRIEWHFFVLFSILILNQQLLLHSSLNILIFPEQIQRIHCHKHSTQNNDDRSGNNGKCQFLSKE